VFTIGRSNRFFLCVCLCLCGLAVSCSSSPKGSVVPTGLQFTSPSSTATIELGQTLSVTVSESVSWSLISACGFGKPAGMLSQETGTTAVYVAPTPASPPQLCPNATTFQDEIVATDSSNASVQLLVVTVNPVSITNAANFSYGPNAGPGCAQGVTTCCPPSGTLIPPTSAGPTGVNGVGQAGTLAIVGPIKAAGGLPPYTWQVSSGTNSLPNGLTLGTAVDKNTNQLDAVIQGKPSSPGCSTFTVTVADSTAEANCDPSVQPGPCSQATFNVVVLPQALKIPVPNYPSAYNDPLNAGQGVPYPATAIVPSGGQAPYFWCQNPANGVPDSTLPPGLELNSLTQPNFDCPTVSTSNSAVISGQPAPGAQNSQNQCNGNGQAAGCYYTQFQVYDSQQPYPAASFVNLSNMAALSLTPCSQANQAPAINSVPPNSYLQGPVAFLLRGFDSNGPVVIAGSVTLDGAGNITGGVEDVTRGGAAGHQYLTIQNTPGQQSWYVVGTLSSSFNGSSVADYSRGCMTLYLANNGVAAGSTTFAFTLGGCTNHFNVNGVITTSLQACGATAASLAAGTYTTGHIIEFDDNTGQGTRASGILRAQDTSSFSGGLSGPFAFGLSGGDAAQKHFAMAGSLNASSGSLKSIAADIDDAGALASQLTGGTGTSTIDATYGTSNGRWTASMSLSGAISSDQAVYMVSKGEALIATTDSLSVSHPIIGGEAITTAASFSNASLQNSHILRIGGLAASGPDVSIGVLSFDGVSAVSGTEYEDQAGTLATTTISANYSVDPATGRAVFAAGQGQNLGPHSFVAYVIPAPASLSRTSCSTPAACVTGFLVGTDSTAQDGVLEFQTPSLAPPPPFTNIYIAGNYDYGTVESLDPLTPNLEGDVLAQPSGTSTTSGSLGPIAQSTSPPFLQDVSYGDPSQFCVSKTLCYLLMPNQSLLAGSYSINANGTGSFGGRVVSVANGNVVFYIDESPTNLHPSVIVAEQ